MEVDSGVASSEEVNKIMDFSEYFQGSGGSSSGGSQSTSQFSSFFTPATSVANPAPVKTDPVVTPKTTAPKVIDTTPDVISSPSPKPPVGLKLNADPNADKGNSLDLNTPSMETDGSTPTTNAGKVVDESENIFNTDVGPIKINQKKDTSSDEMTFSVGEGMTAAQTAKAKQTLADASAAGGEIENDTWTIKAPFIDAGITTTKPFPTPTNAAEAIAQAPFNAFLSTPKFFIELPETLAADIIHAVRDDVQGPPQKKSRAPRRQAHPDADPLGWCRREHRYL